MKEGIQVTPVAQSTGNEGNDCRRRSIGGGLDIIGALFGELFDVLVYPATVAYILSLIACTYRICLATNRFLMKVKERVRFEDRKIFSISYRHKSC